MKYIRDLLSFSVANFVAKLGVFANNQSEAFFMGLLFGPVAVGLYRFAQRVISLVSQAVVSSLQVTSFPQFSRLQDEPKELRNLVIFCLRISATLTMPLMAGIAGSSRLIFATVGAKWAAAAPVLGLLAVAGIIGALLPFTGPLLQARSKPHVLAILCWLDAAVVTAALVSVAMLLRKAPTSYQVAGVALARLGVTALIDAPLYLAFLFRESKMTLAEFGAATFPALTASSAIGLATFLLSYSGGLQNLPPAIGLVVCVGLSALVGGSILYAMDHQLRDWLRAVSRWTPVEQ
jgi:PST family polysaccharide transporter